MASAVQRARFSVPWGLFVVLGVYAALVTGYMWATYWNSADYQAAKAYAGALRILGVDDGRACGERDFEKAFTLLLEAARLEPGDKSIAEHVERLRWRAEQRQFKLPIDLLRHAELVSVAARRAETAREGWLPTSAHDRGWSAEQVLEGPTRVLWWSIPGAVLILALWGFFQVSERARRAKARLDEVVRVEREVEGLGEFRRRLPNDDES